MFCPRCGQERISEETSFCSRCGFLLTAVTSLVETGGIAIVDSQGAERPISPRSRGIRQGLFMFLLTFVIAPIVGLISQFGLGIEPWPMGIVVFGLGIGGLIRIAYAVMFESKTALPGAGQKAALGGTRENIIPPGNKLHGIDLRGEIQGPAGFGRLETNDLQPASVTDHTTKLLKKDRN